MNFTNDPWYTGLDIEERQPPARRTRGISKTFVFGIASLAILLGFSFGLFASDSLGRSSGVTLYDEGKVTELFEAASPAVVEITVSRQNQTIPVSGVGTGSGFIIDREGHIITNNHVVDSAEEIKVNLSDGRSIIASRLGVSPADDLALLKIDASEVEEIEPLHFADSDQVKPGQMALAIGSPFRQFNSVTVGIVSGTGRGPTSELRRPIPNMIQTDAPLNPGNSGGPLLNSSGEVIGVNSAVRTPTLEQFGGLTDFRIGFAVPSNTVQNLMPDLLLAQQIRRPWLGISGGPISDQLAESLGLDQGVVITDVFEDSPARNAGLVPFRSLTSRGDVITAVDGLSVSSVEEMVNYFNSLRPGDKVILTVFRTGESMEVEVTLDEWPDT